MVTCEADPAPTLYRDDETPDARRARHVRNLEDLAEMGLRAARHLGRQLQVQTEAVVAGAVKPDPAAADKLALGLARAARSVRLTYAMIDRLDRAEAKGARAAPAEAAPDAPDAPAAAAPEADPTTSKCGGMIWMNGQLTPLPPLSAYSPEHLAKSTPEAIVARIGLQETRRGEQRKQIVEDVVEAAINTEARSSGTETGIQARCEALYARIDALWESETEAEAFINQPILAMAERVCQDLGVAFDPGRWSGEDWAIADAKEPHEIAAFLAAADPRRLVMRCANGRVFLRGQAPPPGMILPPVHPPAPDPPGPSG